MYSCDGKAEFSAAITLCSVSHNSSEINQICSSDAQETFHIIIISKIVVLLDGFFLWKRYNF